MTKVRCMVDYVFDEARLARGENPYVPAGVWAMSETGFEVAYLPGFEARAEEVDAWLTELVEHGIVPIKVDGYLEYWQVGRASRRGSFSEIVETESFVSATVAATDVLGRFPVSRSPA